MLKCSSSAYKKIIYVGCELKVSMKNWMGITDVNVVTVVVIKEHFLVIIDWSLIGC